MAESYRGEEFEENMQLELFWEAEHGIPEGEGQAKETQGGFPKKNKKHLIALGNLSKDWRLYRWGARCLKKINVHKLICCFCPCKISPPPMAHDKWGKSSYTDRFFAINNINIKECFVFNPTCAKCPVYFEDDFQ